MTLAGRICSNGRLILLLIVAVLTPGATLAQDAGSQTSTPPIVIPPQPQVIKRTGETISIPRDASNSLGKYEAQPTASGGPTIGSRFGYRRDPFTRRSKFHSGLDIKASAGDPVGASLKGTVQFAGWYHGYGNWVIVDHSGGVTTHYAHLSGFSVEVGQKVERGTTVGYAGRTGRATSPHLHYELRVEGNPIDPLVPVALDPDSDFFKRPATTEKPQATADESKPASKPHDQDKSPAAQAEDRATGFDKSSTKRVHCKI